MPERGPGGPRSGKKLALQLKLEKLVEVMPQKGTYVFRIAPGAVAMVSDLRELLELAALATAMQRNHRALLARMTAIFDRMRTAYEADDMRAYRRITASSIRRSAIAAATPISPQSIKEHREILKLVRAGDIPACSAPCAPTSGRPVSPTSTCRQTARPRPAGSRHLSS